MSTSYLTYLIVITVVFVALFTLLLFPTKDKKGKNTLIHNLDEEKDDVEIAIEHSIVYFIDEYT